MVNDDIASSQAAESARLAALNDYDLLDSPTEKDFDLLVEVAAEICGVPYAFISLVDRDRVWHKASFGSAPQEGLRQDSYCSLAIQEDQILVIPDVSQDKRTSSKPATVSGKFGMYSGANLITPDGQRIGTLCVLDTKPKALSDKQQTLLLGLSRQVMSLIELRKRSRELAAAMKELRTIANEDVLTGLATRRALLEHLHAEVDRVKRFPSHLSVIMVDLDHFKQINDRFDHSMGDAVLRQIGLVIRSSIRSVDLAGRYGGEEICLVLPGTDSAGALKLAESLRIAISEKLIEDTERQVQVTASLGVSTSEPGSPRSGEDMIRDADTALYEAKHAGRNRVVVAEKYAPA